MGDDDDGLVSAPELADLVEALAGEAFVADGQDLVDEEHLGVDVDRHGEAQARVHPRRVRLHRGVDEVGKLGERPISSNVVDLFG